MTDYIPAYNDRVRIGNKGDYQNKYKGITGTVISVGERRVGVCLDDIPNPRSKYGAYWFLIENLTRIDKADDEPERYNYCMARNAAVLDASNDILCRCSGSGIHTGDMIAASDESGRVFAVRVANVYGCALPAGLRDEPCLDVIGTVTMTDRARDELRNARIRSVLEHLREAEDEIPELQRYEALAQTDEHIRRLLDEYNHLTAKRTEEI